jgi:phosphoglycerate dehydrogenase-like enzyme
MNTPQENAIAAAEHTIALMFSIARKIPQATASMKAGKWEKKKIITADDECELRDKFTIEMENLAKDSREYH